MNNILLVLFIYLGLAIKYTLFSSGFISTQDHQKSSSIHFFIKRKNYIKMIDKKFLEQKNNKTKIVCITGYGGVGKTTLSYLWKEKFKKNKNSFSWEINASSKSSIKQGIRDLFQFFIQTKDDEIFAKAIECLNDEDDKNKKINNFIQTKLKKYDDWLIIFDNLNDLNFINNYIPQNISSYQKGKVIITTRNTHINCLDKIDNVDFNHVIIMREFGKKKSAELFSRIRFNKDFKLLSLKDQNDIFDFINWITPFPLDIILCAIYMRENNLSFDAYLSCINQQKKSLYKKFKRYDDQFNLLSMVRFNIISLSFDSILKNRHDNLYFLMMINLFNGKNIPKNFFLNNKKINKKSFNNFFEVMKKYKFIIEEKTIKNVDTFSIHDIPLEMIDIYARNKLEDKFESIMHKTVQDFITYANTAINDENHIELNLIINAYDCIKKRHNISDKDKKILDSLLVCIHQLSSKFAHIHTFNIQQIKKFEEVIKNPSILTKFFTHLALSYQKLKKLDEARLYFEKALFYFNKKNATEKYGIVLPFYCGFFYELTNYVDAIKFMDKYIKSYVDHNKLYRHIGQISFLHYIHAEQGNFKTVRQYLNEYEEEHADLFYNNPIFPIFLQNISGIYKQLGDYKKSIQYGEEGVKFYQQPYLKDLYFSLWGVTHISTSYRHIGNYDKAQEWIKKSIIFYKSNFPKSIQYYASLLIQSKIYQKLGLINEALKNIKVVKKQYEDIYEKNNLRLVNVYYVEGLLDMDQKNFEESSQKFKLCLDEYKKKLCEDHPQIGKLSYLYGFTQAMLNKENKGLHYIKKGLYIYKNHYGEDHLKLSEPLLYLGKYYLYIGDIDKSEKYIKKSLSILSKIDHPDQYIALMLLSSFYNKKDDNKTKTQKQSKEYYEKALFLANKILPKNSIHLKNILEQKFLDKN